MEQACHVSVSYLQAFIDTLSLSKIELQGLLIQAGIQPNALRDQDGYLSLNQISGFLNLAMNQSQQHDLGGEVGLSTHPVHWGQLATPMFSRATLEDALLNTIIVPDLKLQMAEMLNRLYGIEEMKDKVQVTIRSALFKGVLSQDDCAQSPSISIST